MSRWRPKPCGCSPRMIFGTQHNQPFTHSPGQKMRRAAHWLCSMRLARLSNRQPRKTQRQANWVSGWRESSFQLSDLTADLARYLDSLETQPGRLEQIAERRAQLSTLTRKYGTTCDEVLQWAAESAVRLSQLELSDDRIATLEERVAELETELVSLATEIGAARREAAARFSELVIGELADLAMPHARLKV